MKHIKVSDDITLKVYVTGENFAIGAVEIKSRANGDAFPVTIVLSEIDPFAIALLQAKKYIENQLRDVK